ncbi:sporulation histidine kinase inhibitor Sda [Paenibacillus turpanensis]|uniref:sporulation histidine kinase inhibitor Sda n=1 Tax=Paenibacillus turpanensis TaxID=2689078 RepID=UPI0014086F7D
MNFPRLSDNQLCQVYFDATFVGCEPDFIDLLVSELLRRGQMEGKLCPLLVETLTKTMPDGRCTDSKTR